MFKGEVTDMYKAGVIEPHRVKNRQSNLSEAAEMILRIDDVIASTGSGKEPDMDEMAGMGGMPGGMPPMM